MFSDKSANLAVMSSDSIKAITDSLPPATDYLTYLTILESHLSPEILPTLNNLLQDVDLNQNIGWDLIAPLLPLPGSEDCLTAIARLGNPREVVLKVTESLQSLDLDQDEEEKVKKQEKVKEEESSEALEKPSSAEEPKNVDRFCLLVKLLAILHPRIKTKYPSRFLSTTLMAILSIFRPSNQATLAIISFVHTISGKKRPPLPGRKSSLQIPTTSQNVSQLSAPDPEAQAEDPQEAAIQKKLLQSFVTHILEDYINANSLEWAARLQESFDPKKVVSGRKSVGESFQEEPELVTRDTIAGQLLALLRDLELSDFSILFGAIYKPESHPVEFDAEENYPSSPGEIPLSQAGSLFLVTALIFSSVLFGAKLSPPALTIFPDHAKLVKHFIGTGGPGLTGSEDLAVIDAILAIGLWLEQTNKFVSGPLEDEEFLEYLQSVSLLSANTPTPTIRYSAHVLTSSVLHAHPTDRLRLSFISDTLEECPYEGLKASAVSWLKQEIITAQDRKSENIFASTVALGAAQPYLFPDTSALIDASDDELIQVLQQTFPFHMAVINFLYFVSGKQYSHVVPSGMTAVVEEIYLGPLRSAQEKYMALVSEVKGKSISGGDDALVEFELLGERIALCSAQINEI